MPVVPAADGTLLHFAEAGEGLPVLALAGLTRDGRDFDHVAPHLAHVRLIRLDARGRGLSGHADPSTYTIPQETADAVALLDHLGLPRAAVLGTSRGGLVAMMMAATAKDRLLGVCLNDVGPVLESKGLGAIGGYIGRRPAHRTHQEAARARAVVSAGFKGVPPARWLAEARNHYDAAPGGLALRYDPRLREAFLALAGESPPTQVAWPLFDALDGLPLALIRGDASDILSEDTANEMACRRPDMIRAEVPGRGHVPFLDEPESLAALRAWLELCRAVQ